MQWQRYKKQIFVAGVVCLFLVLWVFFSGDVKQTARPELPVTIPAFGRLVSLEQAMKDNRTLRSSVEKLLSYEALYLFTHDKQVNAEVAYILFSWMGLPQEKLKKMSGRQSAEAFIRYAYALPQDEPIAGNPLLNDKPWADLFNYFKVRLIMMGQGYKIYDGLAYYDSVSDRMVIQGSVSKDFAKEFQKFLKIQDTKQRKRYVNNLLAFISLTKGVRNLNKEEVEFIERLPK